MNLRHWRGQRAIASTDIETAACCPSPCADLYTRDATLQIAVICRFSSSTGSTTIQLKAHIPVCHCLRIPYSHGMQEQRAIHSCYSHHGSRVLFFCKCDRTPDTLCGHPYACQSAWRCCTVRPEDQLTILGRT